MSAMGQKQTSQPVLVMSALPLKADIAKHCWDVCFVPKANISTEILHPERNVPMRLTAPRFVLPAVAILAVSLCAASLRTMAEEPLYPDRPLTMVVTFTAGGSSDVLARAVADATSRGLG